MAARGKGYTKLETQLRRRQLRQLLRSGFSVAELRAYAIEKQNMTERGAIKLVDSVMKEVIDNMAEYDHRQLAATLFDRFEYLHRQAMSQKNLGVAHQVLATIAQTFLVRPPEVVITGGDDADEDAKGDF